MIRTILTFSCFFWVLICLNAQSLELSWQTPTEGKIVAGPVADENYVYIGNEKGKFLAMDLFSGKIFWEVETGGNIQAKAILVDDLVFFESANIFYALDKKTGKEAWKYSLEMSPEKFSYGGKDYLYKLDPYDDKRSSGYVANGNIYIGTSYGQVIGLNAKSGALVFSVNADDSAPIRATPMVEEGKLYFGDWNGVVYCYDLAKEKFFWKKRSYRKKLYMTFGGIASEFTLHNGMLFFGARNHMLNVLWKENGQKEWTYTDSDGGWIIGDPVVYKDTLYMGGSDNFAMLAFNAFDGRLIWKQKRKKNIYAKPIVTKDWVIYTGGNSYNPKDTGELVMLNRSTGELIAEYPTVSGVFSSPILVNDRFVLFGSIDGTIYSLRIRQ